MLNPTTVTTFAPPVLTLLDRCDSCGAAAKARVVLVSGGELLFCGHHARKHATRLEQLQADLQFDAAADER